LHKIMKRALLVVLSVFIVGIIIWFSFFKKEFNKIIISTKTEEVPFVKISVLNGCGIDGVASDVKNYLTNDKFRNIDVIFCGNVERELFIYRKSIIVVKRKNEDKLQYLMQITGISRRIYAVDENSIEDMQIILGDDFREYFGK